LTQLLQTQLDADLESLIETVPPHIRELLLERDDVNELLEVVLDLGREPEARFLSESLVISSREITEADIDYVIEQVSSFGEDNRAGIERTLHRISAIRNRSGKVVGLTLRVGRAVYGTIRIIEDLVLSGRSVLLLGKPGVGKTTMLRAVAALAGENRIIGLAPSASAVHVLAGEADIPARTLQGFLTRYRDAGDGIAPPEKTEEARKALGGACPRPDPHNPAQKPQVQHQHARRAGGGHQWNQHLAGEVVFAQDERAGGYAAEQGRNRLPGQPAQHHRDECRQQ